MNSYKQTKKPIYGSLKNKNKNNKTSEQDNSMSNIEIKDLKPDEHNIKLENKYNEVRWLTGR